MVDIVILGAGLTGLSAAYHLDKLNLSNYIIFEKEDSIGGLCRSLNVNGFIFDYTGHLIHVNDGYFYNFLLDTYNPNDLNYIQRKSYIYLNGIYTKYPFQRNIRDCPLNIILDCLVGYINRKKIKTKNYYDFILSNFGKGFAKHFFFPFQQKLFKYDLKDITTSWMNNFVPNSQLDIIVKNLINSDIEEKIGYNSNFFYPKKGGIYSWISNIKNKIDSNKIKTNYELIKIDVKNKRLYFKNKEVINYKYLINTIPLNVLLYTIDDIYLAKYYSKLIANSVLNFNLSINKSDISDKHWVYFPEKRYPFYRLGFPYNLSLNMAPIGCSSLYGEISYISKIDKQRAINKSISLIKDIFNLKDSDILDKNIIDIKYAYVIYNYWRERNIDKILSILSYNHKIYSIGRYGAWKYSSMQDCVLDGKKIAEFINKL